MTRAAALAFLCIAAPATVAQDGAAAKPDVASTSPAAPGKPGIVVGVVDFVKVLDAYPRAIKELMKLKDAQKERQTFLENEEKKALVIKQQRDGFEKDSSEWRFKDLELQLAARFLEGKRQILLDELRQQNDAFYGMMLADMEQAVKIVAQERGVPLVLRTHDYMPNGANESKRMLFEARVVWFAAEEIDLTPAVIKLLQVPLPEVKTEAKAPEAKGAESSSGKRPDGGQPDGDQQAGK